MNSSPLSRFLRAVPTILLGLLLSAPAAPQGPPLTTGTVGGTGAPGIIVTVAGGLFTDEGPATETLIEPIGIDLDGLGNLYVADRGEGRGSPGFIYRISPEGRIRRIAGAGEFWPGFDPNAFDAVHATRQPMDPTSFVIDGQDNLYVATPLIYKVAPDGLLTRTVTQMNSGFGRLERDPQGRFYASSNDNRIYRTNSEGYFEHYAGNPTFHPERGALDGFSGDGGPAKLAKLAGQGGLAADDKGNLFIADARNQRIRRIDASGIITTIAGNPQRDPVLRFKPGYSGDGGPATEAELSNPWDVEFDGAGNLYALESLGAGSQTGSRIRKIDPSQTISTVAEIPYPANEIAVGKDGLIYLSVPEQWGVFRLDREGKLSRFAGLFPAGAMGTTSGIYASAMGDGRSATSAAVGVPSSIALDPRGNLYICDTMNGNVRRVTPEGIISTYAGLPYTGMGLDNMGYSGDGGPATQARLYYPSGIDFDSHGNLFIADRSNNRVRRVDPQGIITTVPVDVGMDPEHSSRSFLTDVAVDDQGNLYVAFDEKPVPNDCGFGICYPRYSGHFQVLKFSPGPTSRTSLYMDVKVGVEPNEYTYGDQYTPFIATDSQGNLYLSVPGFGALYKADPAGKVTRLPESLGSSNGMTVDRSGNLFLSGSRIRKVDPNGTESAVAGEGASAEDRFLFRGWYGDGGPALKATFATASDVALDAAGNLYVADGNVRKIFGASESGRPYRSPAPGDLDRDGTLTVGDAVMILQSILGMLALTTEESKAADFDGSNRIDVVDAVMLLKEIVGIPAAP